MDMQVGKIVNAEPYPIPAALHDLVHYVDSN